MSAGTQPAQTVLDAKLTPHGKGLALVLDRSLLDALKIDENTPLKVTTDGRSVFITPQAADEARREKVRAALEDTNRKYGGMLKRLAE